MGKKLRQSLKAGKATTPAFSEADTLFDDFKLHSSKGVVYCSTEFVDDCVNAEDVFSCDLPPGQTSSIPAEHPSPSSNSAHHVFDKLPQQAQSSSWPSISASLGSRDTVSAAQASPKASNAQAPPKASTPWANLFKGTRASSDGHKLALDETAQTICSLCSDDFISVNDTWGPTLVGFVAGRFPGKKAIQDCCSKWISPCHFSIHESGWLLFRFQSLPALQAVLDAGPFFIFKRPLILKLLPPFFRFENDELCKVPVWVRLHSLPFEFWSPSCFNKILSGIGTPIKTDKLTTTFCRSSFARALVNVDISKDLKKEVLIHLPNGASFVQPISYETIPPFCRRCNTIGHLVSSCKYSPPAPHTSAGIAAKPVHNPPPQNSAFSLRAQAAYPPASSCPLPIPHLQPAAAPPSALGSGLLGAFPTTLPSPAAVLPPQHLYA